MARASIKAKPLDYKEIMKQTAAARERSDNFIAVAEARKQTSIQRAERDSELLKAVVVALQALAVSRPAELSHFVRADLTHYETWLKENQIWTEQLIESAIGKVQPVRQSSVRGVK